MCVWDPKRDCFVVSPLFSVARHTGRFKLESIFQLDIKLAKIFERKCKSN